MMRTVNLKISVSGVRGIVGESLTPGLVADFASSFGQYLRGGRVVIGRDTRVSGEILERAVIAGLLATGCKPLVLGVVPTPTIQIAVEALKARGGIVISASHNPAEWNALKFINSSGILLNQTEAAELLDIYNQPGTDYSPESDYREISHVPDAFQFHQDKIFANVNSGLIREKKFRVAVDCCNGAGAKFAEKFLGELGCEVFPIFTETDGVFRRSPEPIPANLAKLRNTVVENSCDIGFAQDPDADRLAIIDEKGSPLGTHYSLALAISHIIAKKTGTIVVNLDTTKAVEDIVRKHGSEIVYSKIGEINVISEILARKAVAGGEGGSGGIIWPAVHPCRDSFTGMALCLEIMAEKNMKISEMLSELPKYHIATGKIRCPSNADAREILKGIKSRYQDFKICSLDGVRIELPDAWILARPSNTEPVIRVTVESKDHKRSEALCAKFIEEI